VLKWYKNNFANTPEKKTQLTSAVSTIWYFKKDTKRKPRVPPFEKALDLAKLSWTLQQKLKTKIWLISFTTA
jgi:hypothetical protein